MSWCAEVTAPSPGCSHISTNLGFMTGAWWPFFRLVQGMISPEFSAGEVAMMGEMSPGFSPVWRVPMLSKWIGRAIPAFPHFLIWRVCVLNPLLVQVAPENYRTGRLSQGIGRQQLLFHRVSSSFFVSFFFVCTSARVCVEASFFSLLVSTPHHKKNWSQDCCQLCRVEEQEPIPLFVTDNQQGRLCSGWGERCCCPILQRPPGQVGGKPLPFF